MKSKKLELLEKIEFHEKIEIELSKWKSGFRFSDDVAKVVGEIKNEDNRNTLLKFVQEIIKDFKEKKYKKDGKLYLSEIIKRDNISFGTNNLILSPVGSGKTYFMKTLIEENSHVLLLVSTTSLKNKMVSPDKKIREKNASRMYSTKHKEIYGEGNYKVLVMTYAEFGERVKFSLSFPNQFDKIFCDEIHSLPLYQSYNDSSALLVAIHYLFSKNENQQKFYFTATNEHIEELKNKSTDILDNIIVFDYLNDKDIKRHIPLSSYKIEGIEQVRPHLKSRKESFEYFGYKIFAFCKTIESQLRLKKICEEEGFSAQAYWSINNEDKKMTKKQIDEANKMLQTERLPDAYDVVIINSSLQEGWDLNDERVKLAIINTLNETEYIQSIGRIRNDLDVLIYKANEKDKNNFYINFPAELIGIPLDTELRNKLCKDFNILTERGTVAGWKRIESILENQGFTIVNKQTMINKKRKRVVIVHAK